LCFHAFQEEKRGKVGICYKKENFCFVSVRDMRDAVLIFAAKKLGVNSEVPETAVYLKNINNNLKQKDEKTICIPRLGGNAVGAVGSGRQHGEIVV
jgi:hypothetical protein